ncbi:MAG: tellurite resistance/C4-dicarboxylate transporter family protein [Devosia sp.]|uniref:tellurite resistance/C4-dicarboxylate transporter family protein n=1 Tax=Devosia sp. TaxID=1871048 RepID=UPI001AD0A0C4|nr:tellurite resistance/C4-dicarboxylate transporter family protein [Devosia sp.]MBN9315459.1 tellurite resistance/C4-dicarboxylate transporter family protein [Devosia sp.]
MPRRLLARLAAVTLDGAVSLFPGYFALVMATGVVSIACHFMGLRPVALALVGINWVAWPVLSVLTIVRALRFRAELMRDLSDHQRAPGFFTIVAGTCVLGTQNVVVIGATGVGTALWWVGLILWFAIMYTFFTAVTVRARKPTLKRGINGAWLIAAVSTQSVVVLRGVIDTGAPPPDAIQFQVIAMFLIGCMLYLAIIPLIFYRLTFVPMSREDFSPPYWINMGAVAITALAGSVLILRGETWPLLAPLLPFLRGFTFFFWAVASWWIPFLLLLMLWRYVWMRDCFTYEPAVWGMVFPLGMYTTSTYQFDRAMGYGFLNLIPEVLVFVALAAWVLAMAGLARRLLGALRAPDAG